MTIQLRFRLTFESDWHISAGHTLGLQADSAIQRDPDGIPIISGSTLKGLFRDALHELSAHSVYGDALPNIILGSPSAESVWLFSAARPLHDEQLGRLKPGIDHAHITTGVRVDPFTRSAERGKLFQREMGSQDLVFRFTVEGRWTRRTDDDPSEQEAVEWLVAAARYVRRLGSRRRRGAGYCRMALEDAELQTALLDAFEQRRKFEQRQSGILPEQLPLPRRPLTHDRKMPEDRTTQSRRFRLILHTDSPLLVAKNPESGNVFESQARIPGSTLRGALAERVHYGALDEPSYVRFLDLFVQGGIAFSDLLLLQPDGLGKAGHVVDQLPLGLMRNDKRDVLSTLFDPEPPEEYRNLQGYARLQSDWLSTLRKDAFERVTQMHVHIDPNTKRAADNDLFAYDAIPRGHYFVGEITLKEHVAWSTVAGLWQTDLEQPFQLHLGKGRRRGYGLVTAWITPLDDSEPPMWSRVPLQARLSDLAGQLVVTLVTDTIVLDHWGRAIQSFDEKWMAEELGLGNLGFAVTRTSDNQPRMAVYSRLVEGFDTLSGLPRWRDVALVAGSSVLLDIDFDPFDYLPHLAALEHDGIGLRRNEGFGRIVFNHPWHMMMTSGFADPIRLPKTAESEESNTHNTRAAFIQEWQEYLQQELKSKPGLFLDKNQRVTPQSRALAHHLVEQRPVDTKDTVQRLTALGRPGPDEEKAYSLPDGYFAHRQKENRFKPEAVRLVVELLAHLEQTYPAHWQRGIVILAETILNLEKQEERRP